MKELKAGTSIDLTSGGSAKVLKELGRGGQGIVYQCEFQGNKYALKWYIRKNSNAFYKNLKANVETGPPSDRKVFLWPLMLTKKQHNSFGYVMALRPDGYKEFGDFLLAKTRFASVSAILNTAFLMCEGFYHLHLNGYSYQDLNDGNFFIDPSTGDLLICDNDNVTAQGENLGIMGKMRYMAPEVVAGKLPDKYSDYFSLAVMLFLLFFRNHPMEGKRVLQVPCMTEKGEKKYYGKEALFIYDKTNQDNLPVRGVHQNVIRLWPHFPDNLKDAFVEAFSQKKLRNPPQRRMESQWEKILIVLRNSLVVDSGKEKFADPNDQTIPRIKTDNSGTILLSAGKMVFFGNGHDPVGRVQINPKEPGTMVLQNISSEKWIVETSSGKVKEVNPQGYMPVKKGLKIAFAGVEKGILE